jgi:four helix bundle protein
METKRERNAKVDRRFETSRSSQLAASSNPSDSRSRILAARSNPRPPAKSFTDLEVWQKAHTFVLEVYRITRSFPQEERFGLVTQFRRAAVSIAANIAEGFRKYGAADKARFLNIAEGSLEECRYYCILSQDLGYGNTQELREILDILAAQLATYIRRVRSQ